MLISASPAKDLCLIVFVYHPFLYLKTKNCPMIIKTERKRKKERTGWGGGGGGVGGRGREREVKLGLDGAVLLMLQFRCMLSAPHVAV